MQGRRLEDYPELQKFHKLYWHQNARSFVEAVLEFREDALSTPATAPIFQKLLEQMEAAVKAGFIAKSIPQTLQVEFWGRHERRISLANYEAARKALAELQAL